MNTLDYISSCLFIKPLFIGFYERLGNREVTNQKGKINIERIDDGQKGAEIEQARSRSWKEEPRSLAQSKSKSRELAPWSLFQSDP
jgi:hypothetical protein